MKYPRLVAYIRGMYEESGAKEGGWSDEEVITDLMRFEELTLRGAEHALEGFGDLTLCHHMGYYNLQPQDFIDGFPQLLEIAEALAS